VKRRRLAGAESDQPDAGEVRARALNLLARREHGAAELQRKLEARGYPEELIGPVLQELRDRGLLSESRFAAEFVRSRVSRGQGPVKIRAELRQQGLPDVEIEEALAAARADWQQLASQVRAKRFGVVPPADFGERARQARFLESRGFTADQIQAALRGE
jgi:regulatory protein